MKLRHLFTALATVLALAFAGCGKSKADEQAAVENFKKEAEGLDGWMKEKQKAMGGNPMAGIAVMRELVAKLKSMKSEDLPADLKEAWTDFVNKISKMEALLAEMGSDPAEMIKKATADPKFMQTFGERMKAIEAEVRPAAQRLTEVGKKYGIEKIGEIAPK
jgi:hypothetical protein